MPLEDIVSEDSHEITAIVITVGALYTAVYQILVSHRVSSSLNGTTFSKIVCYLF